jgi:hypothetical protein
MSYGADGPDSFRWAIAHCRDMMIARSALSPSSPRLRRAALCGFGLDRSARPSKSGDRAANALTAMLGNSGYTVFGQRPTGRVLVFSSYVGMAPACRGDPNAYGSSLSLPFASILRPVQ